MEDMNSTNKDEPTYVEEEYVNPPAKAGGSEPLGLVNEPIISIDKYAPDNDPIADCIKDHVDAGETSFSLPVSWHDLHYQAGKREILRGLTGTALPSRSLAIMGSSGAGKTTFLNALCDRLATSSRLKLSGRRQLGDVEFERHYRKAIGYVTQDDILSSLGTPYDSLWFSLRTRRGTSAEETHQRVMQVLDVLRLTQCKDTVVGMPGLVAGLSGGERKRCNIGVELICDPKVLLLDEPTSGLDSVTSAKIAHLLRDLARTGRTIIYNIHQPTAEVLSFFDDLMLLTQGECIYHGTALGAVSYFNSIGYSCPETYTPTDYYMTLLQDYDISCELIRHWKEHLQNSPRTPHTVAVKLAPSHDESTAARFLDKYIKDFGSSPVIQLLELTRRFAVEMLRNKLYIFAHASQAIFFAVVVGLIFLKMKDTVEGIQDRQGLLFMVVMNRSFGPAFIMLNSFQKTRAMYMREQQAGAYSPFMFFLGKTIAEFPMQLFFILVECCILYWMVGLYNSAGAFFCYFGALTLVSNVATGFGFAMSACFDSLMMSSATVPLILIPLSLSGGMLASTDRLRPYWYWLEKMSFIRNGFILMSRNELKRITNIRCNPNGKGENYCDNQPLNGMQVLEKMGFEDNQSKDWIMWIMLVGFFFFYRIITVIALSFAARRKA